MRKIFVLVSLILLFIQPLAYGRQVIIPAPPQLSATAYLLIDANSGRVLAEKNADLKLPPASITKLMTSYIVASEMEAGSIALTDEVIISVKAWKKGGSKMFIREGTKVSVEDLQKGMIIQSGNDATIALSEHIAGSEEGFVDIMNQQAALLGMENTNFQNATGWPDEGHYSTAHDIALLTQALINDHPESYKIYSERYFDYNGINQPNRNKLLFRDKTVDGVKTGHTDEAGYCLVASSEKEGMRLISVVMGTKTDESRAAESQKLLAYGFRYYHTHKLYTANQIITSAKLWKANQETIDLGVFEDVYLTVPRGSEDNLIAKASIDEVIEAPIKADQEFGVMRVTLDDEELLSLPLKSLSSVEQAGVFRRMVDSVKLFFQQMF